MKPYASPSEGWLCPVLQGVFVFLKYLSVTGCDRVRIVAEAKCILQNYLGQLVKVMGHETVLKNYLETFRMKNRCRNELMQCSQFSFNT